MFCSVCDGLGVWLPLLGGWGFGLLWAGLLWCTFLMLFLKVSVFVCRVFSLLVDHVPGLAL